MLLVSFCMSVLSLFHCQFFEIVGGGYGGLISFYVSTDILQDANFDYAQCKFYSSNELDRNGEDFMMARNCGIVAVVLSGLLFVGSWSLCCLPWDKVRQRIFGLVIFLTVFFQGLTFIVMDTYFCGGSKCLLASGGYICIATVVLLFVTGVIFNIFPKHAEDDNSENFDTNPLLDNQTRTETTEIIGEDGSKVVTTTTYHPDGAVTTQAKTFVSNAV